VAEMKRFEKDVDVVVLKWVCERIKACVWKKEKVEIGWERERKTENRDRKRERV